MDVRAVWMAVAISMSSSAAAWAQLTPAPVPSSTPPPAKSAGSEASAAKPPTYRTFVLTHVVWRVPVGRVYETFRTGGLCLGHFFKTWNKVEDDRPVAPAFEREVRALIASSGLQLGVESDNIFDRSSATTAETELGVVITDFSADYCLHSQIGNNAATGVVTGTASETMEWQVYDRLTKTVLAKIPTSATYTTSTPMTGGANVLGNNVFRENVRMLAQSPAFRAALLTPESHDLAAHATTKQDPILLQGSLSAKARPVADAVGSVVVISNGQSSGSGFLASSDGLLLTDRHVVGDATYVKVRWSDGIESLGEVLRTDKVRDVALVKTDPRGRRPLALRRDPLQPGDTVYAIGSPLGEKFQSTVTRGVVSAYRIFEGLSYIQSDVNVNHGSSGGPLLDDRGEAVGLTDSGASIAGAPANLSLFTPVGDALEFLSAQPK